METLLEQGDLSLDLPRPGEVRTGVIASVSAGEVLVSIGAKSEGVIPSRELEQLTEEEREVLEVGNDLSVFVVSPENRQGTLLLSYVRALEEVDWDHAESLMKSREVHEGQIDGFNKGGLIVHMGRLRGFVPASQVSASRRIAYQGDTPEERWSDMVGEPMIARVIEVDRQRRRLILSEKAASQESRDALKERLLEELQVSEVRKGRVTSLADFGAFVNINGADGLVHLSELSWDRIDHPSEILEVGQEVEVKVISVDHERKRIGLSLRQLESDPWAEMIKAYRVGQLVEGNITRLVKFGAFALIGEHLEGLIHISELSPDRVEHPREVVAEGDKLTLRIIKIDEERRRVGLSLRKVDSLAYSDIDYAMAMAEADNVLVEEPEAADAPETAMEAAMEAALEDAEEVEEPAQVAEEGAAILAEESAEVAEEEAAAEETVQQDGDADEAETPDAEGESAEEPETDDVPETAMEAAPEDAEEAEEPTQSEEAVQLEASAAEDLEETEGEAAAEDSEAAEAEPRQESEAAGPEAEGEEAEPQEPESLSGDEEEA